MKAWSILAMIILFALTAVSQEPAHPGQLFSSDLVSWSFMQEPQQPEHSRPQQQPTPESALETQRIPNPTPAQPGMQQTVPATPESQRQSHTTQNSTGDPRDKR